MKNIFTLYKGFIVLLIISLYWPLQLNAQQRDASKWITPQIPNFDLNDVKFADEQTVIAIGDGGTIVRSQDAGVTWAIIQGPVLNDLNSLYFINATLGFACGYDALLKTTDAGLSWQKLATSINDTFNCVTFTANGKGFLAGNQGIYSSNDNGTTWEKQYSMANVNSISFGDDTTGYAVSNNNSLVKTIDGGNTWNQVSMPITLENNPPYFSVFFLTASEGYITYSHVSFLEESGVFIKTIDGGATWTNISLPQLSVRSIYFTDTLNGYTAGLTGNSSFSNGGIVTTNDGGKTWINDSVSVGGTNTWLTTALLAIHVNSAGNGVAVGEAGTVITTSNSGKSWTVSSQPVTYQNAEPVQIVGLTVMSDSVITTVANAPCFTMCRFRSVISQTSNGGKTWDSKLNYDYPFNAASFPDSATGYALASFDVYKTSDGGANWTDLNMYSGIFAYNDICFLNVDTGFIATSNNALLKTSNGGSTWETINVAANGNINSVFFLNEQVGYVGSSIVLKTRDGGQTWSDITPTLGGNNYYQIKFLDEANGYLVSNTSALYKTADSGKTWVEIRSDIAIMIPYGNPYNYIFTNVNTGFAVGYDGLFSTEDGGQTWDTIYSLPKTDYFLFTTLTVYKNFVYVGTTQGGVLRIDYTNTSGPATAIISPTAPESSFTIYPNPSQGIFTVKAQAYANGTIKIYNSVGSQLANPSQLSAGQAHVNLGTLPAGIYYVELLSSQGRAVQKIIID